MLRGVIDPQVTLLSFWNENTPLAVLHGSIEKLLENAVQHAPRGSAVELSAEGLTLDGRS